MTNPRQQSRFSDAPALPDKQTGPNPKEPSLANELLQLNDDFAEFNEISAFLNHAFATALSDHETLNKDVIAGARRCSNWLQFRSEELRETVRHIHARYASEHTQRPKT